MHKWARNVIKLCVFTFTIILLSACGDAEKVQHIEVFVTDTLEQNAEGLYEPTGYKKVNAITTINVSKNYTRTEVKSVEDLYNREGKYIKTQVVHSQSYKSKVLDTDDGFNRKEELQEPSTLLIPDEDHEHFRSDNLSEDELNQVERHVQSLMKLVD